MTSSFYIVVAKSYGGETLFKLSTLNKGYASVVFDGLKECVEIYQAYVADGTTYEMIKWYDRSEDSEKVKN